jgi:hypothetical protein
MKDEKDGKEGTERRCDKRTGKHTRNIEKKDTPPLQNAYI